MTRSQNDTHTKKTDEPIAVSSVFMFFLIKQSGFSNGQPFSSSYRIGRTTRLHHSSSDFGAKGTVSNTSATRSLIQSMGVILRAKP